MGKLHLTAKPLNFQTAQPVFLANKNGTRHRGMSRFGVFQPVGTWAQARAALALSISWVKAAASRTAISDSALRSRVMLAFLRPSMNWL